MTLRIGFIGSGQIAGWHLNGLAELNRHHGDGREPCYELVALADPRAEACAALATQAQTVLGNAPHVYEDYREMLSKERLDVAALLVPHHLHWSIARDCLDAGLHLQVQKPIAITIADGRRILDYAREKGRKLVVSEPSILGRKNRALLTALRDGSLVGTPTMLLDYAVCTLGGGFFMGTPWRHLKGMAGAGWFLDHGVHRTHWFLEAFGSVAEAYGLAHTFEPERQDARHGAFAVDTEDCAMTVLQFDSGVRGHWMVASAGHGSGFGSVRVYGTKGVAMLDTGSAQHDGGELRKVDELIAPYLEETIPNDAMAHSFAELHALITAGTPPLSSGERALEALAIVYACLEAPLQGKPVRLGDVLSGAMHLYEDTIEAARAQWLDVPATRVS
jgi:UDP-N-acetyl-2-amino-2-deoxyglucuronate dehydrogenase